MNSLDIDIPSSGVILKGILAIPAQPQGIVIFVHGSGSSRHSPRNQAVADKLNHDGLATLLFDLLTEDEESDRGKVFDIDLLSNRLIDVTHWVQAYQKTSHLSIGYFGASTGAAAALVAACSARVQISAVVCRGGRVDLAGKYLPEVTSPTLMMVGEEDRAVLELNIEAQRHMKCENKIEIVPLATHLFEEPGALELVAQLASQWFVHHVRKENL